MTTYTPAVTFNVKDNVILSNGIKTGTIFILSTNNWGPVNTLEEYEGSIDIATNYKSGTLVDAANLSYYGGFNNIKVYRIAGSSKAKAAYTLETSSVDKITLTAKYYGTYGNSIGVEVYTIGANKAVKLSVGSIVENYNNDGAGYSSNSAIVTAINASSNLVVATLVSDSGLVDDYTITYLAGGDNGSSGLTSTDYMTVVTSLVEEEYDVIIIPDNTSDTLANLVGDYMRVRAAYPYQLFSKFFFGIPSEEAYATTIARSILDSEGRITKVAPGTVRFNNTTYSGSVTVGYYAGLVYSSAIAESTTHKSYALETYVNYASNQKYYTRGQVENLVSEGWVVIDKVGNFNGIQRAVTSISTNTSSLFEEVVRLETDYILKNLKNRLVTFIGQKNTLDKRELMQSSVEAFMDSCVTKEYITNYTANVYLVSGSLDKVGVALTVVPVLPINDIDVDLTLSLTI